VSSNQVDPATIDAGSVAVDNDEDNNNDDDDDDILVEKGTNESVLDPRKLSLVVAKARNVIIVGSFLAIRFPLTKSLFCIDLIIMALCGFCNERSVDILYYIGLGEINVYHPPSSCSDQALMIQLDENFTDMPTCNR